MRMGQSECDDDDEGVKNDSLLNYSWSLLPHLMSLFLYSMTIIQQHKND
jgi:hypothetical protein